MRKKRETLLSYEQMKEKTFEFYQSRFNLIIERDIDLAIQSLIMPNYLKQLKDLKRLNCEATNHNGSLATLGDAIINAFLMDYYFKKDISSHALTKHKVNATNEKLNQIGKALLAGFVFHANNDLEYNADNDKPAKNKKGYATVFEAVVGFLYKYERSKCDELLYKTFPLV